MESASHFFSAIHDNREIKRHHHLQSVIAQANTWFLGLFNSIGDILFGLIVKNLRQVLSEIIYRKLTLLYWVFELKPAKFSIESVITVQSFEQLVKGIFSYSCLNEAFVCWDHLQITHGSLSSCLSSLNLIGEEAAINVSFNLVRGDSWELEERVVKPKLVNIHVAVLILEVRIY